MTGFGYYGQVFGATFGTDFALTSGSKVAFIGDSIVQQGLAASSGEIDITARSGLSWAQILDPRFRHPNSWVPSSTDSRGFTGYNHGMVGETTAQMLARIGVVLAQNPDIVLIAGGTNDVAAGLSAATIIANLDAMASAALQANRRVGLLTIRPRATTGVGSLPVGDAKWAVFHSVNQWIRAQNRPRLVPIDLTALLSDGTTDVSGNGSGWFYRADPAYLFDNVHLSHLGGWQEGKAIRSYLAQQIAPDLVVASDPLAAGNGLPAAALAGTAGTISATGTGISGQIATGWQIRRYEGDGGSVNCAKELVGNGLEKQVLTLAAGSSTSAYETHALRPNPDLITLASLGWAAGDWVQFGCQVELGAWDRWRMFRSRINFINGAGTPIFFAVTLPFLSGADSLPMPYPSEPWSGWLMTPPVPVPSGTVSLAPALEIRAQHKDATGSGIIRISRPSLRRVAAPAYA